MKKRLIKLLMIISIVLSLFGCNKIPTDTTTTQELDNIYFLTDKEYTYKEIVKWAMDEEDVMYSSLIATCIPIECDEVGDDEIYLDLVGSNSFDYISISRNKGYEIADYSSYMEKEDDYKNQWYNLYLDKDGEYTFTFGEAEETIENGIKVRMNSIEDYVLNNVELEYGHHYLVFCGTVEQFLKINSHKGNNKVHDGSSKVF